MVERTMFCKEENKKKRWRKLRLGLLYKDCLSLSGKQFARSVGGSPSTPPSPIQITYLKKL